MQKGKPADLVDNDQVCEVCEVCGRCEGRVATGHCGKVGFVTNGVAAVSEDRAFFRFDA
jgi:hypothetical protein